MSIAGLDKIRNLLSRFCIDDSTEAWRLAARHANHSSMVRNHSDLNSANSSVARNHLFRIVSLKLVEMAIVEQTLEQLSHVIRLPVIFGNDFVEFFGRSCGFAIGFTCARTGRLW